MCEGDLRVQAVLSGDDGEAEVGVLTFLDNRVDTTTGQIRLKGTFKNENLASVAGAVCQRDTAACSEEGSGGDPLLSAAGRAAGAVRLRH